MSFVLRSLLFVPADSERKIARAMASEADVVILDLEDSVALPQKDEARMRAAEVLKRRGGKKLFLRINSLASGLADADIEAALQGRPDGIVLPKTRSGRDVLRFAGVMLAGGMGQFRYLRIRRNKGVNDERIVHRSTPVLQNGERFIGVQPRAIRSIGIQCVKAVDNGENSRA